jgi:hypothetical protein
MSSVIIAGDTSGTVTLAAPAVAGTTTLTLPATTGTVMVNGPAFSAYNNANQSISSSTATVVQLQVELFDTAGCFNNTGSTVTLNGLSVPAWSFCPNVAGYYQINATVQLLLTAPGQSGQVYINKNGGVYSYGTFAMSDPNSYVSASASQLIYLNGTGDYVTMSGWQGTGVSRDIQSGGASTRFSGSLLRSA